MGKLNVAIADDNEVMRDLLEEMVTSDDELHLIGMAKDGEEACHLIKEKEPDVVLLDIIMPKLDGLAVLDRIRADHTLKNRPTFLMISGISNEKITEDAFERGADYYIMKPFDRNIVLDRIKTLNRRKNKVRKEIGRPPNGIILSLLLFCFSCFFINPPNIIFRSNIKAVFLHPQVQQIFSRVQQTLYHHLPSRKILPHPVSLFLLIYMLHCPRFHCHQRQVSI